MNIQRVMLSSLFFTVACFDADKDGLSDSLEAELGSDPNSADSDGDGLDDAYEHENGLNPTKADSDGDGCSDGDETNANSDPTSADETPYTGNWPCNPNIESMEDPGWGGSASVGAMVPRYVAQDQFGEDVEFYDFANNNFILVDLSGLWCGYCRYMAGWLDSNEASEEYQIFQQLFGNEEFFTRIPELVDSGEITWITVIDGGSSGGAPTAADVQSWWTDYPNPHVPILLDADLSMQSWIQPNGWPSVTLIGPDGTVLETGGYDRVLKRTLEWYDANNQ